MRFNSDGTLDSSFDSDGWVELPRHFGTRNIDMQADGKLVISGTFDTAANFARLNFDGSLDTSFDIDGLYLYDPGGCCASPVIHSTTISNGKLVVLASLKLIRLDLDPSVPTFDSIADTVDVLDDGGLELVLAANSISENGGSVTATVTRLTLDLSKALTVTVTSNDSSEVAVPTTVTIPVDATSATFTVDAVDDQLLDNSQTVSISVTNGSLVLRDTLEVLDHETVTVTLAHGSISETIGATTGTVTRSNTDNALPLLVALTFDDTEAVIPQSVTIPAGEFSVNLTVTGLDDGGEDGAQTFPVQPTAQGYASVSASLAVFDDPIPWQNPTNRYDVDNDEIITPTDVRIIINDINRIGPRRLLDFPRNLPPPFLDVNGDGFVAPGDVLVLINEINHPSGSSEGEFAFTNDGLANIVRAGLVDTAFATADSPNHSRFAQDAPAAFWWTHELRAETNHVGIANRSQIEVRRKTARSVVRDVYDYDREQALFVNLQQLDLPAARQLASDQEVTPLDLSTSCPPLADSSNC
jgi:hypothetical protein